MFILFLEKEKEYLRSNGCETSFCVSAMIIKKMNERKIGIYHRCRVWGQNIISEETYKTGSLPFHFLVAALLLPFHSLSQLILSPYYRSKKKKRERMKQYVRRKMRKKKDEERGAAVRFFRSCLKSYTYR